MNAQASTPGSSVTPESHRTIHIVLVEPTESLNVGSVARAMSNLGFESLRLVAPRNFDQTVAKRTACWADSIINNASHCSTLAEALVDMQDVVGFTARHGKHRPEHLMLSEWCEGLSLTSPIDTALVFGSEASGLTQEQIQLCRALVRIPSSVENPAYNLAQSVLLALFAVSQQLAPQVELREKRELPTWNEFEQLDRVVDEALQLSGFYRRGSPQTMPGLVKNLVRRLQPDAREMRVLLAMVGRVNCTLKGESPTYPISESEE